MKLSDIHESNVSKSDEQRLFKFLKVSSLDELKEEYPWDTDDIEDTLEDVKQHLGMKEVVTLLKILDYKNVRLIRLPNHKEIVVTKDNVFEDSYLDRIEDWIADVSDLELFEMFDYNENKWSREFWQNVHHGSVVWHNTEKHAWEDIQKDGVLKATRVSRGLTNSSTGSAVFVTMDPDATALGNYGPISLEIDLYTMKKNHYMPMVSEEEPIVEHKLRTALAHLIGYENFNDHEITSDGLDYNTLVIFGDIPIKYIEEG